MPTTTERLLLPKGVCAHTDFAVLVKWSQMASNNQPGSVERRCARAAAMSVSDAYALLAAV